MIGDFSGIVTEGFTIPKNSVLENNFCEIMCWLSNSNRVTRV